MSKETRNYTAKERMTLATRKVELGKELDEEDEKAIQKALMNTLEGGCEESEQEMQMVKEVISLFRQIDNIKESLTNDKLIPLVRDAAKNALVSGKKGKNPKLVNQHYAALITKFQDKYHKLSDSAREVVLSIIPIEKVKKIFS